MGELDSMDTSVGPTALLLLWRLAKRGKQSWNRATAFMIRDYRKTPGHIWPAALPPANLIGFMADIEPKPTHRAAIKTDGLDEDAFSFEAMEIQDIGMDRGALMASDSPADFLFANGQLLPHAFCVPPDSSRKSISKESLTSSSSKGSSSSSRSNSNGGNSLQNSDSKSSSDAEKAAAGPAPAAGPVRPVIKHVRFRSRDDIAPLPPRWQFMLSPERESPRRRKANGNERQGRRIKNQQPKNRSSSGNSSASCRIFRSFVSACRECHALEPSMQVERRAPPAKMAYRIHSQTYI